MPEVKDYQIKALKKEIFISNLKVWIIAIFLIAEILFVILYFTKSGPFGGSMGKYNTKVAIVHYNRQVTEQYTSKIMEKMDAIRDKKEYKSVLFIMNSPGGSPTASEELSEYLKEYKKDKNITMYVESMAASGGYYIASAIKPLIANKNAILGSIGVIMPHYNIGELADKVGVKEDNLAAGKYKQPISLFRAVDPANKQYIQDNLLTPTYNNFINSVATNRGLTRAQLLPFTEGKIYIANSPQIKGILVDKISTLYKVKQDIKKNLGTKKVGFIDITKEEKFPFMPKVQLDLNLKELVNTLQPRY